MDSLLQAADSSSIKGGNDAPWAELLSGPDETVWAVPTPVPGP